MPNLVFNHSLKIGGSKSETNRVLLLNALFGACIDIRNTSNSEDSDLMEKAIVSSDEIIDIHHAGTAMRFLTAYFSIQEGREVLITGSDRMKERPIKVLVEALQNLGADITYEENEGFPPLRIKGKKLEGGKVSVSASTSSQYLSALLLVGAKMKNGLELELVGKITSRPYLEMTTQILSQLGISVEWYGQMIKVMPQDAIQPTVFHVESDWSSASYHYELLALSSGTISLETYKESSLQADSALVSIYKDLFGVETRFVDNKIILSKAKQENANQNTRIELNLNHCPDIAQTIACTCVGLRRKTQLTGLSTLRIKETDRLMALKTELEKLGVLVSITDDSLHILGYKEIDVEKHISISTYNDHRMAMSFAPLSALQAITIENPAVVGKSYPDFWEHVQTLGLFF